MIEDKDGKFIESLTTMFKLRYNSNEDEMLKTIIRETLFLHEVLLEARKETTKKIKKIIRARRKELAETYENQADKNTQFAYILINCKHEMDGLLEVI